jgi:hypothetical protein
MKTRKYKSPNVLDTLLMLGALLCVLTVMGAGCISCVNDCYDSLVP